MHHPLYFAYGSNLSSAEPHVAEHLTPVGPARLPDFRLAFSRRSARRHGGVLDVVRAPGSVTPGFLFRVSDDGWRALDDKEGVKGEAGDAYERLDDVTVFDLDDRIQNVRLYHVSHKQAHVPPSDAYLKRVHEGRVERQLPTGDLAHVAEGDPHANALANLFVYGTLLHGQSRAPALVGARHAAETRGQLYDCGDYPGLVLHGASRVQGELVHIEPAKLGELLGALDVIEGFHGHERDDSLFLRRPITVRAGHHAHPAWAYQLADATDSPLIHTGDWRTRRTAGV